MLLSEVATMIQSMGLPFAYRSFEDGTAQAPPFICYLYTGNNPEPADNKICAKIETLVIELYTDSKDFSLEATIEAVLDSYNMVYSREEEWISSEKIQLTSYTMDVVITKDPVITDITTEV